jgi:hypothetical protein
MDIWGLCPTCDTWFPCERWFDRAAPEPTCPSCGEAPTAIENRTVVVPLTGDSTVMRAS